jgi:hypothetical protein
VSLESKIDELIVALNKHTAALLGTKGGSGGGAAGTSAGKPPAITFEQIKARVVEVKDQKGKPAAQNIIKTVGKANELASIKPAQFAAVMKACEDILNEDTTTETTDEEDTL